MSAVEEEDEEQTLAEQLEQQQAQLDAINDQLAGDPSSEDLQQLKGSLVELVDLLKGELLRVKKAKLLSAVDSLQFGSTSAAAESNQQQQNKLPSSESSSSSSSEEEEESLEAVIEQFNGQECSVPFGSSNQYHDAILKVAEEESGQNQTTPESLLFTAFFLYPLSEAMLTCPFYLKGSCRFMNSFSTSTSCKYSHGHRVTVGQIRPKSVYSIGDEVNFQKGEDEAGRTLFGLVRNAALPGSSSNEAGPSKFSSSSQTDHHNRHLWTRCEIVKTDPSSGRVLVKLVRDCTDFWVPMEMLVLVDQQFEKGDEEEVLEVPMMISQAESSESTSSITNPSVSSFGEWERYTSGIGSKLLLKMGYTSGTGLGSRSQGILNPVESFVFPPGKSLDTCFTLKAESERKKLDIAEVLKEKAKKLKLEAKRARQYEKTVEKVKEKAEGGAVFRFLDDMFHSAGSSSASSSSASVKPKAKSESVSRNQTKSLDAKSLALSAFKVDEELKRAEGELRRYEESLRRNFRGGKGKAAESAAAAGDLGLKTIQQKRDRAKAVVEGLRRRQLELGRETTRRKEKQKMVF